MEHLGVRSSLSPAARLLRVGRRTRSRRGRRQRGLGHGRVVGLLLAPATSSARAHAPQRAVPCRDRSLCAWCPRRSAPAVSGAARRPVRAVMPTSLAPRWHAAGPTASAWSAVVSTCSSGSWMRPSHQFPTNVLFVYVRMPPSPSVADRPLGAAISVSRLWAQGVYRDPLCPCVGWGMEGGLGPPYARNLSKDCPGTIPQRRCALATAGRKCPRARARLASVSGGRSPPFRLTSARPLACSRSAGVCRADGLAPVGAPAAVGRAPARSRA
jgi:hypothetical protein